MEEIERWQVYHVYCHQTTPAKFKYVVVVYVTASYCLGFLINSETPRFVSSQPELYPCMVDIRSDQHSFLRYDSVVDCMAPFTFPLQDLTDYRGEVEAGTQQAILRAVEICPRLRRGHRRAILGN